MRERLERRILMLREEFAINTLKLTLLGSAAALAATLPMMANTAMITINSKPITLVLSGLIIPSELMIVSSGVLSLFEIHAIKKGIPNPTIATSTTALPIIKTVIEKASKITALMLGTAATLFTLEYTMGEFYTNAAFIMMYAAIIAWKNKSAILAPEAPIVTTGQTVMSTTAGPPPVGELLLLISPIVATAGLAIVVASKAIPTLIETNDAIWRS